MESNWTKAEFKSFGALQGLKSELTQLANETLARELSVRISAFLRTSFTTTYMDGVVTPFGDLTLSDSSSCFGLALLRPDESKLVIELEHAALFPLLGVALGAKAGSFASPDRRPTEIELQVVQMLLRLILAEVSRAWSGLVKKPLEAVTFEIEPTPARTWPVAEPVFTARFQIASEEPLGLLRLIAPLSLLSDIAENDEPRPKEASPTEMAVENTLEALMSANVSVAVWLDGSQMLLGDLLQLREGQIVKLDHPLEASATCTINGEKGFVGQVVSTGARRAFLIEEYSV